MAATTRPASTQPSTPGTDTDVPAATTASTAATVTATTDPTETPSATAPNPLSDFKQQVEKTGGKAKDLLLDYAASIEKNKHVQSFEEYLASAKRAGVVVAGDVEKTAKDFMANTDTGKAITSASGKAWDATKHAFTVAETAVAGAATAATNGVKQLVTEADEKTDGELGKNKWGIGGALLGGLLMGLMSGDPLMMILGVVLGALGGSFFGDQDSGILARTTGIGKHDGPSPVKAEGNGVQIALAKDGTGHLKLDGDGHIITDEATQATYIANIKKVKGDLLLVESVTLANDAKTSLPVKPFNLAATFKDDVAFVATKLPEGAAPNDQAVKAFADGGNELVANIATAKAALINGQANGELSVSLKTTANSAVLETTQTLALEGDSKKQQFSGNFKAEDGKSNTGRLEISTITLPDVLGPDGKPVTINVSEAGPDGKPISFKVENGNVNLNSDENKKQLTALEDAAIRMETAKRVADNDKYNKAPDKKSAEALAANVEATSIDAQVIPNLKQMGQLKTGKVGLA